MYTKKAPLFLHCQTPLHAGSGSDLGVVDLPIQRERHTGFPKIEGSSLKGAIRETVERQVLKDFTKEKREDFGKKLKEVNRIFGYDEGEMQSFSKEQIQALFPKEDERRFAGAVGFTDARLLLFPIKSMRGVFAYATCPTILRQLMADLDEKEMSVPKTTSVASQSSLLIGGKNVILEEYTFSEVTESGDIDTLAAKLEVWFGLDCKARLILLPDDDFADFVQLSTEVITRTKINNETGTVSDGALFTEEYLPAESVLYSMVLSSDEFSTREDRLTAPKVEKFFEANLPEVFQIGANATLGKGLVKHSFHPQKEDSNE